MSQRNSARRIQQPGSKCSNPKPSPHKKPNRAPGEGRFRTENEPRYWDRWFAWNHRRKPKLPNRDSPPSRDCIAEAYEKIPARVYRHNLAIVDKVGEIGQKWHRWRGAGLVDPRYFIQGSMTKNYVPNRRARGAAPVNKLSTGSKRMVEDRNNISQLKVVEYGPHDNTRGEIYDSQASQDYEPSGQNEELHNESSQQLIPEEFSEWFGLDLRAESEFLGSGIVGVIEDEYVVI